MTTPAEQQQRNQASMALLEKMGAYVDKQLADEEERVQQEESWRDRCVKPEERVGEE